MDKLESYLEKVIADMQDTRHKYESLLRPELKTYPVPFFGDVQSARVLTVGVNPSATEFEKRRNWSEMKSAELKSRLMDYFISEQVDQHNWFKTWDQALLPLGVSYQDGAAHVDLSPRATKSRIKTAADLKLFAEMLTQDVQWFFKLLPECHKARLILIAGGLPDGRAVNKVMKLFVTNHGFQFEGPPTPKVGTGKIGFYHLRGPGVSLPAFFCSVSPSARHANMLPQRVEEHKEKLLELLNERPDSART